MDLIKTLLVYMIMVISGAVQAAPAVAPPTPGVNPSATPYTVTLRPVTAAPTATPTLRPTAAPTATPTRYTSLYVGDRGDAVTKLQRRLAELGYLNDKIDGIFGKNTKAAVERFQYYNNLTVDGIAGQKTQAMLYESTAVVTAPPDMGTPRPTATPLRGVTVPVYYVNENSVLIYSTVITCYADTTIYANGNYVGANYELTSSGAVNVTIRNGTATPASVTFRYHARATETPVPNVVVPIYYQDQATGRLLYSSVTAPLAPGRTHYITASAALAPAGYELVGSDTVTVVVSADGVATPPSVIFTFRNTVTEAPATEVPATEVPVTEAPATEVPATEVPVTEAPATEVPATEVPVTEAPVTEAPATEAPATEVPVTEAPATEAPATDVPEPQYAVIPVYYMDEEGPMIGVSPIKVQYGTTAQVTPESGIVDESEFTLMSDAAVTVIVDANGTCAPDTVTFTYRRIVTATDVPVLENGKITVELRLQGTEEVLFSYEEEVKLNSETQVYAKYESLDPKYVPVGDTVMTVFVDASGNVNPAPVFYFADTTPAEPTVTEAPATEAPATEEPAPEPQYAVVPVRYLTEDGIVLGESAVKVLYGGTMDVTPEAGVVNENDFMLVSAGSVTVTADANGVCTPDTVVFTYRRVETPTEVPVTEAPATEVPVTEAPATEEPAPEPQYAVVPVRYLTEDGIVLGESAVKVLYGGTMDVTPEAGVVNENDFMLVSAGSVTVTADANGVCTPDTVVFTYRRVETPTEVPVTEAPATEVPVTEAPATETLAPEPQYASVPVRYLTEDGIVLGESAVKVLYGGTMDVTPEAGVVNENDFTLVSAASVTVTADANGVCTPDTVVFTYRRVETPTEVPTTEAPAPAPALTDGGYSVQIDGNTIPLNWMKDQGGNAMVSLRMLAGAAGWSYSGGSCEINGHSVAVSYDANGVYTLSVDGSSYAGSAIVFDNDLYVGLPFIRALGYDASASGSSIVMNSIAQ